MKVGRVLFGEKERVADFVLAQLPHLGERWHLYEALGVVDESDELLGGVVYHDYNKHAADIHITAAFTSISWCSRQTLYIILAYPIRQLGLERATMLIARSNTRAIEFARRLGFRLEGVMRRGHDGREDRLVYGVLREEVRFWKG